MAGASAVLTIPLNKPPFQFNPRQISMDWHRLCALDVERVAQEVDVAALQEHITGITFCNLDGEQCLHCEQPLDPTLLKMFRMAQLIIEYLLHCQEVLQASLATHAQRLQAAHAELAHTQQQAEELTMKLCKAKKEKRIWKKKIVTQQPVLQDGPNTCCKCHVCDKGFKNSSFLQDHLQHQHAENTKEERQTTKKVEKVKREVEELKVKLQELQQQLEAGKLCREQEMERARQHEEDVKQYLEKWKEEERTKLHEEIDGLRQLFFTVFMDVASRSSAMERKLQELQAREVVEPIVESQQKNGTEEEQWQAPNQEELCGEQERMAVQIKLLSASKSEVTQEVTKLVSDEESSGEEKVTLGSKQRLREVLQRNPDLLKQLHPIMEEALEEKLESMGVKRVAKGISPQTYKSLQAQVTLQRQQRSKKFPGLLRLRDKFTQALMEKVKLFKKPSSASQFSIISDPSPKSPRSLCGSQSTTIPDEVEPDASVIPQPTPQSRDIDSPSRTPWDTLQTSKASSPHQGLVQPQNSDAMLGGKPPTLSHVSLSPKQEPELGDETDSDMLDPDLMEEPSASGTATPTLLRPLEKRLDAVAQRPPRGVTLFPAVSLTSLITIQSSKKLQFTGESGRLEITSVEDLAELPPGGDRVGTVLCQQPLDGATRPGTGSSCSETSPALILGTVCPSF